MALKRAFSGWLFNLIPPFSFCASCASLWPSTSVLWLISRSGNLSQLNADQGILAPRVEAAVSQGGIRADAIGEDLSPSRRFETIGRGGRQDQLAVFPEHQQSLIGQSDGARAAPVLAPAHLAALQLDASQIRTDFLAPVESVEESIVADARRVMIGQHVGGGPDLVNLAILTDTQENGARFIAGGKKNEVANDQRRRRADGGVHAGPPRKIEEQFTVGRIQSQQSSAREKEGVTPVVERGGDR